MRNLTRAGPGLGPGAARTRGMLALMRYRVVKRLLDVVGAVLALAVTALPLLIVLAVVKASDPGAPALFRQARTGRGGRPFTLLKVRTMRPGAEGLKDALRAGSCVAWPDFRLHDDPRVTPIGGFLRKTSIDEVPQLVNVLRGHMSLVGPRPTSFSPATYALWQTERLEVKPGLTGPWQVEGRTSLGFEERCRLEIAFFRQPSLRRDLAVLARTPPALLRRPGVA